MAHLNSYLHNGMSSNQVVEAIKVYALTEHGHFLTRLEFNTIMELFGTATMRLNQDEKTYVDALDEIIRDVIGVQPLQKLIFER